MIWLCRFGIFGRRILFYMKQEHFVYSYLGKKFRLYRYFLTLVFILWALASKKQQSAHLSCKSHLNAMSLIKLKYPGKMFKKSVLSDFYRYVLFWSFHLKFKYSDLVIKIVEPNLEKCLFLSLFLFSCSPLTFCNLLSLAIHLLEMLVLKI